MFSAVEVHLHQNQDHLLKLSRGAEQFSSWSDSLIKSDSFLLQGRREMVATGHWDSAELPVA